MREIASLEALRGLVGADVAVTDWMEITQQRVNSFADATDDHQWIHVDPERCRRESPFGGPIAHGFLTLSLLPAMLERSVHLSFPRMIINYGVNKVRFPAPVPVGSRVRGILHLQSLEDVEQGAQLVWRVTIEDEAETKPVCVAELVIRLL
ncbi:MaoC family dehydratase [Massilia sp. TS11]|uniref:MaoC family dehydratase n=1 Tax=Massilia sp. TS11 TaxID=2908003 RepID=UPI001EDACA74|nr:MaoC family dehydratase [Massilia sp. TS11]MCG2584539.1 MaoC family dehydratase [Massilia sp. TS11]